jgi:hypothetical protein
MLKCVCAASYYISAKNDIKIPIWRGASHAILKEVEKNEWLGVDLKNEIKVEEVRKN